MFFMISFFQAIVLGFLQGVTELFPVSSLGHSVIIPALFGWQINQNSDAFLTFLVATHFATALVLLGFFWNDWVLIGKGVFRSLKNRFIDPADTYAKLGWMIVIATIPVGILGVLFQEKVQALLSSAKVVAIVLVANGVMLFAAEYLRKKRTEDNVDADTKIAKLSWFDSVKVGLSECIALVPGFSRTGSTLAASLASGLDHDAAARFSFLLAAPVIFAAALLKLPDLFAMPAGASAPTVMGAVAAAIAAYFSVKFLSKYFKTKTLAPFAGYCLAAGAIFFFVLAVR
ncbi:MAG: undecaprenyl-diphosphatase [Patescibacteria group bacterium]|nr:undecaprenyl-diphosphatase [Patescibacteria group bacterium]MDE1945957.1 undecaprenyl-diphosphatase [Patescibacteria group bacterium]